MNASIWYDETDVYKYDRTGCQASFETFMFTEIGRIPVEYAIKKIKSGSLLAAKCMKFQMKSFFWSIEQIFTLL